MKKRKLALLLTVAMIISMFPFNAFATEFSDMPDDWSTKALENAVANGLLKGDDGKIMPKESLTRAQMATIVNRAFGTTEKSSIEDFTDVKKDDWYYDEMAKAVQMKTFIGSGDKLYPNNNITREESFVVLARAFKLSGANENTLDKFSDKNNISDWAKDSVSSLVAAGYISGSNGQVNPKQNVTRQEFAQMMDNLIKNYINTEGTYTTDYSGNLMINVPNVTLKGLTITGDLIIGDGVGNGTVTLDSVTVTGRTVLRGGGENSIRIIGNSNIQNIIIARVDGVVRVYSEDGTEIGEVIVDGSDDVIIEGTFGTVTLLASNVTVTATDATIESATVDGEDSKIVVEENSTINTITVTGQGTTIEGKGKVESVEANANDVTVNTPGTSVTAGEGATGVTVGGNPVQSGETVIDDTEVPTGIIETGGGSSGSSRVAVSAISVDEDLVLEKVDNSYTITATVFPSNATNKNLTWTTSDESVATVDNGVITAVGPGTATITVTSVADSSKKATVHVVVGDILVPAIFADDPTLGTLQGEIDKAEPGSTIVVAPATYNEQLIINKPLTLLGPNADIAGAAEKRYPEAIIKGTGNGLSQLLEIDAENVEINGFTFDDTRIDNYNNTTGTNTNLIGGIAIVNNRFINTSGTAIYLRDGRNAPGEYSKDIQICNNKIETIISAGTVDYNAGSGIIVMGAEDLRICGNIISNAAYNGIQLARNKNATVTDNIVTDSEQPALQIAQWNEGVHEISGNTFSTKSEEKGAIRLYGFTNNYIPEFNISNNKIENSHYGIQIGHGDAGKSYNDIRDANYSLIGNIFDDISEHELIIYLNTEPSNEEAEEMNTLFEDVYGEGYCARLISENDPFVYIGGLITWNDYADTSWYDDNPSAASFTIDTAEELAGLSKLVNENKIKFDGKTIFLGADIDLNNLEWVPIGSYYGTWFGGVFDGGDKEIKGIRITDNTLPEVGLFGYVRGSSDEAGIQNLTVSGRIDIYDNNTIKPISANNHTSEAGLLAAYVWGFVDNCHTTNVKDDNTVAFRSIYTGDRYRASIGGLVGLISVGDIKNSSFTGTVYGETDVTVPETNSGAFIGGLIGLANGSNVIKCDVDADVTGNTYRYLSLGGAIGYIKSNDRQYSDISYQGTVYGNVNIEGKQCQISTIEVGGLIGAGEFGGNTQIHNNTAEGILFGNAAANDHANVSVGGIVGEAYLKSNLTSYSLENNVTNLQISVEQTADALINVGGLVGTMYNASASANPSLEITFNACQVKGSINVESTVQGSDTECYVGGLLGSGIKLVDGTFVMNECTTITPTVSVDTSVKSAGDYWGRNDWAPVYIEGDEVVFYPTIQAAINAAEEGDTIILGAGIFEEGTINLPVRFEGITIKGSENHASIIKNSSIYRADGNNLYYNDIIIEGIVFDNSYILVTGQRTGTVEMNNWEIKNNIFRNLTSAPNSIAAVHFNLGEGESAKGFVLTGNVFDNISNKNSTGQALWNNRLDKTAYIKNNVFMNLTDEQNPLNIQIENNNGNNDLIEITGNIFDTKFWPYIGGRSNTGEDSVTLKINDNEFYQCGLDDRTTVITVTNFNSANTSADLSNNHYDIDPSEYLDRFRYNGTIADSIEDLELLGFTPYYIIDAE